MLNNIYDTGCGGALIFEWIDEWTKASWITAPVSTTPDRRYLWHDVTNPEQNFGLITFDQGEPDYSHWEPESRNGYIEKVESAFDNEFFYCRLTLSESPADNKKIIIGYDTYGSDIGESVLPDGVTISNRAEFALGISLPDTARLYVTEAYDTFGIWHGVSGDEQLYHSVVSDGAPWKLVRWKNNSGENDIYEIGKLGIGYMDGEKTSLDAVTVDNNTIEIRVPWTLLNFTDPSAVEVLDDDRSTTMRETAKSDGIALTVSCGGQLIETSRYLWTQWNTAPATYERDKDSMTIFGETLKNFLSPAAKLAER